MTTSRVETPAVRRTIEVQRLGRVDYTSALELQQRLVEDRRSDRIGDTLLLLEHPPVITVGARNRVGRSNIIAGEDELRQAGITVHEAGRGGDVTYHGPGQLIGYPVLDLKPDRCDVHQYVRDLEEVLIQALRTFHVTGTRVAGLSGVWVGPSGHEEKIAAIGVRISRWVTSHGFALNVATNLDHFETIVPCGISGRRVTSLVRLRARPIEMATVEDAVIAAFRSVFM